MRGDKEKHQDDVRKENLGKEEEVEVRSERVRWKDLSKASKKVDKFWISRVMDYGSDEYEYNWDMEFLDRDKIDGDIYISIKDLCEEDIIRVSGGSPSNDPQCYYVEEIGDEMVCRRMDDIDAVGVVERRSMREKQEYIEMVDEKLNEMETEDVKEVAEEIGAIKKKVAEEI